MNSDLKALRATSYSQNEKAMSRLFLEGGFIVFILRSTFRRLDLVTWWSMINDLSVNARTKKSVSSS